MARRNLFLLIALTLAAPSFGGPVPTPRKRVALALSGGGAYGLMYLGALEWMERHRIPVDAIVGTSGGALVGGWYATGIEMLSDDEARSLPEPRSASDLRLGPVRRELEAIDFEHLFDSGPDYRNLSMLQKRERRMYPNDLYAGLAGVRGLRRDGLVPGQAVGFFLDYIGRDYGQGFDDLPTPFRAVTVDAADSDASKWRTITLGGLNPEIPLGLSRAIRASIAVPFLFAPVQVGSHRLIDGAVRDNLPTDVAIDEFDPDVLIALRFDNGSGPDPYQAGRRGRDAREKAVITFDPRPYRVDQFARWRELAWIGYRGMEAHRAELERFALSPAEFAAYRLKRRAKPVSHRVTRVTGDVGGLDDVRRAVVGRDLDDMAAMRRLGRALDRLVADEGLATAGYDLRPGGLLMVRTTRHRGGPTFVRAGANVDVNSGDRRYLGLAGRISDLRAGRTDFALDGVAGTDPSLSGSLEFPIGQELSLGPSFRLDRRIEFLFNGESRHAEAAVSTAEAGLGVYYRPTRAVEISAVGLTGENNLSDRSGAAFDPQTGPYREAALSAELDTTDDAVVPRRGTRALLQARRFEADRAFWQGEGHLDLYGGQGPNAYGLHGGFGTSFGGDATFPFEFRPLVGPYRRDEIRDDGYLSLGLSGTREIGSIPFALGRTFLVGRFDNAWASGRSYPGATLYFLADTRAGAFSLGVGMASHGAVRFLLGLGGRF